MHDWNFSEKRVKSYEPSICKLQIMVLVSNNVEFRYFWKTKIEFIMSTNAEKSGASQTEFKPPKKILDYQILFLAKKKKTFGRCFYLLRRVFKLTQKSLFLSSPLPNANRNIKNV